MNKYITLNMAILTMFSMACPSVYASDEKFLKFNWPTPSVASVIVKRSFQNRDSEYRFILKLVESEENDNLKVTIKELSLIRVNRHYLDPYHGSKFDELFQTGNTEFKINAQGKMLGSILDKSKVGSLEEIHAKKMELLNKEDIDPYEKAVDKAIYNRMFNEGNSGIWKYWVGMWNGVVPVNSTTFSGQGNEFIALYGEQLAKYIISLEKLDENNKIRISKKAHIDGIDLSESNRKLIVESLKEAYPKSANENSFGEEFSHVNDLNIYYKYTSEVVTDKITLRPDNNKINLSVIMYNKDEVLENIDESLEYQFSWLDKDSAYEFLELESNDDLSDNKRKYLVNKLFADAGDPVSQYIIGVMYRIGHGTNKNMGKAIKYYTQSAEQGLGLAQLGLGHIYKRDGEYRDFSKSRKWYMSAAKNGDSRAWYKLAIFYIHGKGVKKNTKIAIEHLEEASKLNHKSAQNDLAWLLATSNDDESRDGARALKLMEILINSEKINNYKDKYYSMFRDTMAAANAEVGQFEDAIRFQQEAIDHLIEKRKKKHLESYLKRLQTYKEHKPWRAP